MSNGYKLLFGDITPEELAAIRAETDRREAALSEFQHRDRYEDSETETDNNILRA